MTSSAMRLAAAFALASTLAFVPASSEAYEISPPITFKKPGPGDTLPGGGILAIYPLVVSTRDAPGQYTYDGAVEYCRNLVEDGYDNWELPSQDALLQLFVYKDYGALKGTFKTSAAVYGDATFYWASDAPDDYGNGQMRGQQWGFSDSGITGSAPVDTPSSVRCIRRLDR